MFQNSLMAGAAGQGGFYDYQIDQSLRFNDDDSAYLSRTPAGAGNRKTWTWSGWVKRGNLGAVTLFSADNSAGNFSSNQLAISAGGNLFLDDNRNVTVPYSVTTSALLRDPSAWYHIVVILDTSNATTSDRVRFYINGSRITNFSSASYPALNLDGWINGTVAHYVGRNLTPATGARNYFDGYMAEVNFIDGLALDPTSFGEFKSGVWVPKEYTGSYGTNGFYLSFADSAAIGDDLSGNGNDWTPSGLASTDVLLDSPTNNYATWNPLTASNASISFHEANLKVEMNAAYPGGVMGSFGVNEGKFYWEVLMGGTGNSANGYNAGVATPSWANRNTDAGTDALAYTHLVDSRLKFEDNSTDTINGVSFTVGDTIGIALNCDDNEISYYKNGILIGSARTLEAGQVWIPYCKASTSVADQHYTANFGQSPFAYTPPAGFLALNTANLPEPTITPALDDVPADYFNTVLYTGTGATQSITGVGFQPNKVWVKNRGAAFHHGTFDIVRGANVVLSSSQTAAEVVYTEQLTSFDADGFSLGDNSDGGNYVNLSGNSYVAWNWKANGAGVANTDGTISSTVSANQKAGFSIVSFTAPASGNFTVGHGLGATPQFFVVKARNGAGNWVVWHGSFTNNRDYIQLNLTDAKGTGASPVWGDVFPDSAVFGSTVGFTTFASLDHIAYCFAEVEGYSKFGSYTGNGSADGPFVWCGFRPALVLAKSSSVTGSWCIFDAERNTYNLTDLGLLPNSSRAEAVEASNAMDFLSNGFKLRAAGGSDPVLNSSGQTVIFAAWAKNPFKYSNAR